jgi:hypothetical protein
VSGRPFLETGLPSLRLTVTRLKTICEIAKMNLNRVIKLAVTCFLADRATPKHHTGGGFLGHSISTTIRYSYLILSRERF